MIFLSLMSSCHSSQLSQWEIQEIITSTPRFNAGRLLFSLSLPSSPLELEISRTYAGICSHINLLGIEAMPCLENAAQTQLEIVFQNQDPLLVYAHVLIGSQRLLLSKETTDMMIDALLKDCSFTIRINSYSLLVRPDQFASVYEKLHALPISF